MCNEHEILLEKCGNMFKKSPKKVGFYLPVYVWGKLVYDYLACNKHVSLRLDLLRNELGRRKNTNEIHNQRHQNFT